MAAEFGSRNRPAGSTRFLCSAAIYLDHPAGLRLGWPPTAAHRLIAHVLSKLDSASPHRHLAVGRFRLWESGKNSAAAARTNSAVPTTDQQQGTTANSTMDQHNSKGAKGKSFWH